MLKTITCCHCKEEIKANPRLKGNQKYCGEKECQRSRKRQWKHEKIQSDEGYREKQNDYLKQWRKEKPFHRYMSQYRQNHVEYVESNRQNQRQRNQTRRQREKEIKAEKIVKVDALMPGPVKTNTYEMTRFERDPTGKIVKVDTLMVQLKQIQALSFRQS